MSNEIPHPLFLLFQRAGGNFGCSAQLSYIRTSNEGNPSINIRYVSLRAEVWQRRLAPESLNEEAHVRAFVSRNPIRNAHAFDLAPSSMRHHEIYKVSYR